MLLAAKAGMFLSNSLNQIQVPSTAHDNVFIEYQNVEAVKTIHISPQ